jgi:hypothetical protein
MSESAKELLGYEPEKIVFLNQEENFIENIVCRNLRHCDISKVTNKITKRRPVLNKFITKKNHFKINDMEIYQ